MADEKKELDCKIAEGDDTNDDKKTHEDLVEKLVNERLDANLKPIKEKLDSAYERLEASNKKVKEFEAKERAAELKRLEDEGKHQEVFNMRLAEERAAKEALAARNIELTRDVEVRAALASQDFRNEKAVDMAFQDVVKDLIRNEAGVWVHRSGVSIKDYVKTFIADEDNAFLLKVRTSSGSGGAGPNNTNASSGTSTSLFAQSQEEVLKKAASGTLRKRQ